MANRLPFLLAAVFTVLSFILCIVGFGTGYWWVTTDDTNTFTSAGLWQICFNGYEHTSDLIGKAYYGCWWIFYKEYYYIRDWILPSWFIAVQTLMTFAVVFEFLALALFPLSFADVDNVRNLTVTCVITGLITCCISTSVVIFGVMIGLDRTWMPGWHLNVLGWSYGLVVVAGFLSTFSFIGILVYTLMRKYELATRVEKRKQGAML
jgi:hypothetical protein